MAIELTMKSFEQEVLKHEGKILIDFWAPRCMPCRAIAPMIEELSEELTGRVKVCKVNVDEQMEIAVEFGIMSIPTLVYIKDGKAINQMIGARGKSEILKMLEE